MQRSLILVVVPLLLITEARLSSAQVSARELRSVTDSLYLALARGDSTALRRRLMDDLVWVIGASGDELSKAQLLAAASHPQNPTVRFDIDSVQVQGVDNVALVSFRRTDHRSVGGVDFPAHWR